MRYGRDEFSYLLWWWYQVQTTHLVAAFFSSTEIGSEHQNGVHAASSFCKTFLEYGL